MFFMEAALEKLDESIKLNRSVNGKLWHLKEYDERHALAISQKFSLPDIVAKILAMRGVELEEIEDFLNPSIKSSLPDPSHLLDMDKAAGRLGKAVIGKEKIAVFGDYDVDGATSSAILKRFFRALEIDLEIYIPDRIEEGYGPSAEAFKTLKDNGNDIVITVDCGTVAFEALEAAKNYGLEIIVIDHHIGTEIIPDAVAIVNPNRIDETSPHRNLCAAGLAFLLVTAVNRELRNKGFFKNKKEPDLLKFLDLVALGTVCDVMTLTGLNRSYVAQGLKVANTRENVGLRALADVTGLEEAVNTYALGFILGPRINAGGRVGKSDLGARMLSTEDPDEAYEIAIELDKLNKERKTLEELALEEATKAALDEGDDEPVLILGSKNWHQGVIGIVASRLKDIYDKPVAIISFDKGIGKASARSVNGIDLGAAVTQAKMEGILTKGGGHKMAAGFEIEEKNLEKFKKFLKKRLNDDFLTYREQNSIGFEGILSPSGASLYLKTALEALEPFGVGNREPKFLIKDAKIIKIDVFKDAHISCIIGDASATGNPKTRLKTIAFRAVGTDLGNELLSLQDKKFSLIGKLKENNWMGKKSVEFLIEDLIL